MNYELSIEARNDLHDIWLYTFENWTLQQATTYVDLILDEIERIASKPSLGISISIKGKDYKYFQIKSHLIYYRESSSEIKIIRVLHKRMDIETHLA